MKEYIEQLREYAKAANQIENSEYWNLLCDIHDYSDKTSASFFKALEEEIVGIVDQIDKTAIIGDDGKLKDRNYANRTIIYRPK